VTPARWAPAAAVAAAALALFTIEPFVGKVLLPRLGGTPMVWNTCVMAFQALLLVGYAYSRILARAGAAGRRWQLTALGAAIAVWPFAVRVLWTAPRTVPPVLWITAAVVAGVGVPFIVLSATSPLAQVWAAASGRRSAHRLYAVSNLASLAALIGYVALVEPLVGVTAQSWLIWALLIATWAFTLIAARLPQPVFTSPTAAPIGEPAPLPIGEPPAPASARPRWFVLSFAASFCLYSVNTFLATDVAAFPLLFVVPLALFLLAFAAGFSAWAERWPRVIGITALAAAGAALWYLLEVAKPSTSAADLPWPLVALTGLVLALAERLAAARPADRELPAFYTMIGAGGLAAGIVAVVGVPMLWTPLSAPFRDSHAWLAQTAVPEYPLALVLGMALAVRPWILRGVAAVALFLVMTATAPTYGMGVLFQARNFFGTVRVQDDPSTSAHRLKNGTTLHGFEIVVDDVRRPVSYYHPASPIGQLMTRVHPGRVTAFGLGTGTLAAYARRGDDYTFLEINPLVIEIANDPRYFAYLTQARRRGATVTVREGDGRLSAATLPRRAADLIVLDAFSSDSIPAHLLTEEAFREYEAALAPGGAIAVHVSNRFFDLEPAVSATAAAAGFSAYCQGREEEEPDESRSSWLVLLRAGEVPEVADRWGVSQLPWRPSPPPAGMAPWTDDWANLLGRLRPVAAWLDR
jgi:spermidine synthase